MNAMLIKQYGSPDNFYFGETATPKISADEILVKVAGSSVNPIDAALRSGSLKLFIRLKLPVVLGVDVSGVVAEVGSAVKNFKVGDRVYAFMGVKRNGGYGEYVAIPESFAAHIPSNLDTTEAGVAPGVGMTAYEAFTVHAPLSAGMKVLINGATGGVGTYAVQIAKSLGAEVVAVCSTERTNLAERLGADRIIDYRKRNILETSEKYDVILNCVRGISFTALKKLLKPDGKSIIIAGSPVEAPIMTLSNMFSSQKSLTMMVKTDGVILRGLSNLIETGKVEPIIESIFSWKDLAEAHRKAESGKNAGKIGIAVS